MLLASEVEKFLTLSEKLKVYLCMEVIIIFWFVVSTCNSRCKKKKQWLFKLTNSGTLAQCLMLHACIKVQKLGVFVDVSVL